MDEMEEIDDMGDMQYDIMVDIEEIEHMEYMERRGAFVLGANIREDMDIISESEQRIRQADHYDDYYDNYSSPFEVSQRRNQNFQKYYDYPARRRKLRMKIFQF